MGIICYIDNDKEPVFILLALANVFFPPLPVESLSVFAGYLSQKGDGNAYGVVLSVALGGAIGSAILFFLAHSQGKRLLKLGFVESQVTPERLEKARAWLQHYGLWMIFVGKLIPGMGLVTIISSGLFRMGARQALTAIFLTNFVFFSIMVALGHLLGEEWRSATQASHRIWPYVLAVAALVAGIVGLRALVRKRVI